MILSTWAAATTTMTMTTITIIYLTIRARTHMILLFCNMYKNKTCVIQFWFCFIERKTRKNYMRAIVVYIYFHYFNFHFVCTTFLLLFRFLYTIYFAFVPDVILSLLYLYMLHCVLTRIPLLLNHQFVIFRVPHFTIINFICFNAV